MTFYDFAATVPLLWAAHTDLQERRIPDWTVATVAILAVLKVFQWHSWLAWALMGGAIGALVWLVALIKGGAGGGDLKLFLALSILSGPTRAAMVFLTAGATQFIIAAILRKERLPFAPFLLGAFCFVSIISILI